MRCKVVAYIKADEIDKALAAIRAAERLPIDLSYYKVKRLVLALAPLARWVCPFPLLSSLLGSLGTRLWLGCGSGQICMGLCPMIK